MRKRKIALLLGRGIEGCGPTRLSNQMADYFESVGCYVEIFAADEARFSRRSSHAQYRPITAFKLSDNAETLSLAKKIANDFDTVYVNSLPVKEGKNPSNYAVNEVGQQTWNDFIDIIADSCHLSMTHFDHSTLSIRKNACLGHTASRCKYVYTHSLENNVVKCIKESLGIPDVPSLFDDGPTGPEFKVCQPGVNFDQIRSEFYQPYTGRDMSVHRWIGRTTTWKGYEEFTDFAKSHLSRINASTIIEGMEKSIAFSMFRTKLQEDEIPFEELNVPKYNPSDFSVEQFKNNLGIFGPYNHKEMMTRMGQSGFGYQLSRFRMMEIGKLVEHTHNEIVCSGTVPVFSKEFGDKCLHRTQEIPLTSCSDSGTIWLDPKNPDEAFELIKECGSSKVKYKEMNDKAFEFYKFHQDASHIYAKYLTDSQ